MNENFLKAFIKDAEIHKQNKKEEVKKNQFREWGKKGGRPKKEINKTKIISLRFTVSEYQELLHKSELAKIKIADYCRIVLRDKPLVKEEQNKTLIQFGNNFKRIGNFMKMGVFSSEEKARILTEIEIVLQGIKNNIKW